MATSGFRIDSTLTTWRAFIFACGLCVYALGGQCFYNPPDYRSPARYREVRLYTSDAFHYKASIADFKLGSSSIIHHNVVRGTWVLSACESSELSGARVSSLHIRHTVKSLQSMGLLCWEFCTTSTDTQSSVRPAVSWRNAIKIRCVSLTLILFLILDGPLCQPPDSFFLLWMHHYREAQNNTKE